MGNQSYWVAYDDDEAEQRILAAIKAHNEEPDFDLVGETLRNVVIAEFKKPYRRTWLKGTRVILFNNGGGRSYTFAYMLRNGIDVQPFTEALKKHLNDSKLWRDVELSTTPGDSDNTM
jgi:hypothetical protein